MKGFALLLAIGLTMLYGFVVHAAMTGPTHVSNELKKPVDSVDVVWHGGIMDPVTVIGRRSERTVVTEASDCPPGRVRS